MKLIKKILPFLLITALLFTTILPVFAAGSNTDPMSKEEVVYIQIAADGTVESIYVVNIFGAGDILDYGDYSEVKNLNTSDKITQNGEEIRFSSLNDRVYYQGKLKDNTIPWNISIQYFIDGTEYSAADAAGRSGKLELRFRVSKNENARGDFFDTYALQVNFTFDTKKCTNIIAEGATAANAGSKKQLSYTILPGKGIDTTITADVKDFEMGGISMNGIPLALDVDVNCDDLLGEVRELLDAIATLDNGAQDLQSGAGELCNGASELKTGAEELFDGARDVTDGASSLKDGAADLRDGVTSAHGGSCELDRGLTELSGNSAALREGAYQIFVSLTESAEELLNANLSAAGLSPITLTPENYVSVLEELLQTLSDYSYAQATAAARAEIEAQVTAVFEAAIREQAEAAAREQVTAAITGDESVMAEIEAGVEAQYGTQISTEARNYVALQLANQYAPDDPEAWLASSEGQATVAAYLLTTEGQSAYDAARAEIKAQYVSAAVEAQVEAQMNSSEMQTAIDQTVEEQLASDSVQVQITSEAEHQLASEEVQAEISAGAETGLAESDAYKNVVALSAQLSSYEEFYTGLESYTEGVDSAAEGASELKSGMSDLLSGAGDLAGGAAELYDGCTELKDGAAELKNGASDLYGGTAELYDGCLDLCGGTATLRSKTDGMDCEIQDRIDEMICDITGGEFTVRSFVSDRNTNVNAVQFVIQTNAIEMPEPEVSAPAAKEELNFFQKLLRLFGLY